MGTADEAINIPGTPLLNGGRGLPDPSGGSASKKTRWVCLLTSALVALLILAIILLATLGGEAEQTESERLRTENESVIWFPTYFCPSHFLNLNYISLGKFTGTLCEDGRNQR